MVATVSISVGMSVGVSVEMAKGVLMAGWAVKDCLWEHLLIHLLVHQAGYGGGIGGRIISTNRCSAGALELAMAMAAWGSEWRARVDEPVAYR